MRSRASIAAAVLGLLASAAGARADDLRFGEYVSLGQLERTPAPLVPTRLPPVLEDGTDVGTSLLYDKGGSLYELVYKHIADIHTPREHVDETLDLHDYGGVSLARARRALGPTFTARPARVRGHRGFSISSRFTTVRALMWSEDGHTYEVSTATPKKVSIGQLRATASGLQHLLGAFYAQPTPPSGVEGDAVQVVVADHAVYLLSEWSAACTAPGAEFVPGRGGSAEAGWLPLAGGAFAPQAFSVASPGGREPQWSGSVSGNASSTGGTVTFQAAATLGAESCSTGAITATLTRLPKLVKSA